MTAHVRVAFGCDSPMTLGIQFLLGHLLHDDRLPKNVDVQGLLVAHSDYQRIEEPFTPIEYELLASHLERESINVLGISSVERTRPRLLKSVRRLKERIPDLLVLAGGIDAISDPVAYFRDGVDLISMGDGEVPTEQLLRSLAEGKDCESLVNDSPMGWTHAANPSYTKSQSPDVVPLPYYGPKLISLFEQEADGKAAQHVQFVKRAHAVDAFTQRGCTHACSFCAQDLWTIYGGDSKRNSRRRPLADIVDQLCAIREDQPHRDYVYFWDLDFLRRSKRELLEFAHSYKQRLGLPFFIFVTEKSVNAADVECISALVRAGMGTINMGLQSGSNRMLSEVYRRKNTAEEARQAIHTIHEATRDDDVEVLYDIITYSPQENQTDILESIRLISEVPTDGRQRIRLSSHLLSSNTGQDLSYENVSTTTKDYQDFLSARNLLNQTQTPYLSWLLGQMLRGRITTAAIGSVRRSALDALMQPELIAAMERDPSVMKALTYAFVPRENEGFQ